MSRNQTKVMLLINGGGNEGRAIKYDGLGKRSGISSQLLAPKVESNQTRHERDPQQVGYEVSPHEGHVQPCA